MLRNVTIKINLRINVIIGEGIFPDGHQGEAPSSRSRREERINAVSGELVCRLFLSYQHHVVSFYYNELLRGNVKGIYNEIVEGISAMKAARAC